MEYEQQSLLSFFKKGTYDEGFDKADYKEPHYIIDGGMVYDSCQFDGNNYSYGYDKNKGYVGDKTGNLIQYQNGAYTLHGEPISNVEKTKELTYSWTDYEPAEARLGYTWFNYAYYAASGDKNSNAPEKYAEFSARQPTKPDGVLGVDFITDGTWETYTEYYGSDLIGKYYQSESGNYIPIRIDTEIPDDATIYTRSTGVYYRKYIGNISDARLNSNYFQVYPYSFTNVNNKLTKVTFGSGGYMYFENGVIKHSPTYYLWQGGYTTVEVKDGNNHIADLVFIETGFEYNYDLKSEDGSTTNNTYEHSLQLRRFEIGSDEEITADKLQPMESVSLQHIVANWDDYKTKSRGTKEIGYVVVEGNEILGVLDDLYQVYSNKLYAYAQDYAIDENNHLCRIHLQLPSTYSSKKLYLSNSNFGLYTRYKYLVNSNTYNFETIPAGWKILDPEDPTKVIAEYNVVPEGDDKMYVNLGRTTMLSETCLRILPGKFRLTLLFFLG